jgi:hypothetical protein
VAFRSNHGQHLQAHPDGAVVAAYCPIDGWERFTVEYMPHGAFYLRTNHDMYLSLEENGTVRSTPTKSDPTAIFRFIPQPQRGPSSFALVTARGSYVQASPGSNEPIKESTHLGDSEIFEKIPQSPMSFSSVERTAFRSLHGQHMQAHADGSIMLFYCPINDWERFTLEYLPEGGFHIRTTHGTYVNLEENGTFRGIPVPNPDGDSVFHWVPQLQRGPSRFALVTARGSYLRAPPGNGECVQNSLNLGAWEIFERISV